MPQPASEAPPGLGLAPPGPRRAPVFLCSTHPGFPPCSFQVRLVSRVVACLGCCSSAPAQLTLTPA